MFKKITLFFNELQKKDEKTKKKYLVFFSVLFSLIIIFAWFWSLKYTLPTTPEIKETIEKESISTKVSNNLKKIPSSLKSFFETLKIGWHISSQNLNKFLESLQQETQKPLEEIKNFLSKEKKIDIDNKEELKFYIQKYNEENNIQK